jgi:transposase
VQIRTQLKNKVHAILFRNAIIYAKTTLFTKQGRLWLDSLDLNSEYRNHLNSNLKIIDSINEEIVALEKDIKKTIQENESLRLLRTIPGVGDVTALTILSEIGDIHRFKDPRHLHSYAGLVPRVQVSGEHAKYGSISKDGSKFLRYIMIETAHHQLLLKRKFVGLKWYYQRLAARKSNQMQTADICREIIGKDIVSKVNELLNTHK